MFRSSATSLRLLPQAKADLRNILEWSRAQFGEQAAERYAQLLTQVWRDLREDPQRLGARSMPALHPGVFVYHLSHSRDQAQGEKVRTPRHIVVYRLVSLELQVLRVLHDSCDLPRHLPSWLRFP